MAQVMVLQYVWTLQTHNTIKYEKTIVKDLYDRSTCRFGPE